VNAYLPVTCRTYKISSPLVLDYQSQLIGDARNLPTLLAASNFNGRAIIGERCFRHCMGCRMTYAPSMTDADPTLAYGAEQWTNQNNL
jgi:glucan 1,3-beta-glucosidase